MVLILLMILSFKSKANEETHLISKIITLVLLWANLNNMYFIIKCLLNIYFKMLLIFFQGKNQSSKIHTFLKKNLIYMAILRLGKYCFMLELSFKGKLFNYLIAYQYHRFYVLIYAINIQSLLLNQYLKHLLIQETVVFIIIKESKNLLVDSFKILKMLVMSIVSSILHHIYCNILIFLILYVRIC